MCASSSSTSVVFFKENSVEAWARTIFFFFFQRQKCLAALSGGRLDPSAHTAPAGQLLFPAHFCWVFIFSRLHFLLLLFLLFFFFCFTSVLVSRMIRHPRIHHHGIKWRPFWAPLQPLRSFGGAAGATGLKLTNQSTYSSSPFFWL